MYNDVGAKPLVLTKNYNIIKYASKYIFYSENLTKPGGLVCVKLLSQVKLNT